MPSQSEVDITEAEEQLRKAMLSSDLVTLDRLVSEHLVFTNHFGQLVSKDEDLHLHRSGMIRFFALEPSEVKVFATRGMAVVSVRMLVKGVYAESSFETDLRYTRTWLKEPGNHWKVVAGHMCQVQPAASAA